MIGCGSFVLTSTGGSTDDGRSITLRPAALEKAQPLRLGYASHALKLRGGQAAVVLVLPGGLADQPAVDLLDGHRLC